MRHRNESGFTLIELIVTVSVTGVIAAVAIPSLIRLRCEAEESAAIEARKTTVVGQALYREGDADQNQSLDYPEGLDGLNSSDSSALIDQVLQAGKGTLPVQKNALMAVAYCEKCTRDEREHIEIMTATVLAAYGRPENLTSAHVEYVKVSKVGSDVEDVDWLVRRLAHEEDPAAEFVQSVIHEGVAATRGRLEKSLRQRQSLLDQLTLDQSKLQSASMRLAAGPGSKSLRKQVSVLERRCESLRDRIEDGSWWMPGCVRTALKIAAR